MPRRIRRRLCGGGFSYGVCLVVSGAGWEYDIAFAWNRRREMRFVGDSVMLHEHQVVGGKIANLAIRTFRLDETDFNDSFEAWGRRFPYMPPMQCKG